jgi:hypothetical protein
VFNNSPTLIAPNLGTPVTLVLTNATGLPVAGGGTGGVAFADGGVIIGNGTGPFQNTGSGNAGEVLTSNGVGVDPSFQPSGSSPLVALNAPVTITAAATETSVFVQAIPANTLTVNGHMAQLRVPFTFTNGVAATLALSVKLGSTPTVVYLDATQSILLAAGITRPCSLVIDFIRSSSTTCEILIHMTIGNSTGATTGIGDLANNPQSGMVDLTVGSISAPWTWAATTTLDVTFNISAATSLSCKTATGHFRKLQ